MATLTIHFPDGITVSRQAIANTPLLTAMGDAARTLQTSCGGAKKCGKCLVRVSGSLSPADPDEQAFLPTQGSFRLACCARLMGDAEIWLPDGAEIDCINGADIPVSSPLFSKYGLAVDIGTTTLAARLYGTKGLLAQEHTLNPQRVYGADVISRIQHALEGDLSHLTSCIRQALNDLISVLASRAGISCRSIDYAVITGNTAMLYFLTGNDPRSLSQAPFLADDLFDRCVPALSLELSAIPCAQVYLPPCFSAFVGADIACALLSSRICQHGQTALLADIGTNGELALWHNGQLRCCSTAAGPVFEGASLSCGMQGSSGAIDHVAWDGKQFVIHTIHDAAPRGICGSGAIDIAAALLDSGLMEESGALLNSEKNLCFAPGVLFSQKDVRMLQLAKAAVCAGIQTLLESAELSAQSVSTFALAGNFGSYMNPDSAAKIGLYPPELLKKISVLGNAALSGAALLLLQQQTRAQIVQLQSKAVVVELSGSAQFTAHYTDCLFFNNITK